MYYIKNLICLAFAMLLALPASFSANNQADALIQFTLSEFVNVSPVTSPVLTANITDRTGNLHAPLNTRFKVVTNSPNKTKLYLKADTITDIGSESAMFEQGGQVYVAFANLAKIPSSSSLANCKNGSMPKDSPGVVAYPVISISGAEYEYLPSKGKYQITVGNGTSYVDVHIGSHVLKSSFASNDPRGFYQAILSLTEADI